jgi:uncharacterized protein YndB with AHSA1/START domain
MARTKEHQMTNNAGQNSGILGSLRSAGDTGVVRIEHRYDADIDEVWSALTDPSRLARWYGQVDGDLRVGGEFRVYIESDDVEAIGQVVACEPATRLRLTTRETDESYQRGQGVPPHDEVIEATLTAEKAQSILVIEVRGIPLDPIAFYGAGWQIHAENLAAHIAGRERGDTEARWSELVPPYQDLAANLPSPETA